MDIFMQRSYGLAMALQDPACRLRCLRYFCCVLFCSLYGLRMQTKKAPTADEIRAVASKMRCHYNSARKWMRGGTRPKNETLARLYDRLTAKRGGK
jgi:hypothetical protein